jgi:release factor glutamine methyltransferase
VRFEPLSALASGTDGLDDIRCIASQAATYLEQGAWLLLEHGYDQAAQVRDIFLSNGFVEIFSAKDIAGIDRVSGGVKPRQA